MFLHWTFSHFHLTGMCFLLFVSTCMFFYHVHFLFGTESPKWQDFALCVSVSRLSISGCPLRPCYIVFVASLLHCPCLATLAIIGTTRSFFGIRKWQVSDLTEIVEVPTELKRCFCFTKSLVCFFKAKKKDRNLISLFFVYLSTHTLLWKNETQWIIMFVGAMYIVRVICNSTQIHQNKIKCYANNMLAVIGLKK